jgi:lipid-A-disaccharide synthase-like uncharacterized protein
MNDVDNEVEVVSSEVASSKVDPRIIQDDLMSQNIPDKELSTESVDNRESIHYQGKGRKVTDFLLGFLGVCLINLILDFVIEFIVSIDLEFVDKHGVYIAFVFIKLIGVSFSAVYFLRKSRKYIAIGIISMSIIGFFIFAFMMMVFIAWS